MPNNNVLKSSLIFFNNGSIVRKIQEKRFLTFLGKVQLSWNKKTLLNYFSKVTSQHILTYARLSIYIYIYYKNEIENGYDDNTLESALTFLGKIPSWDKKPHC